MTEVREQVSFRNRARRERARTLVDAEGDRECPAERLSEVAAIVAGDDVKGLDRLDGLIGEFPRDARLHFLRGSVLAGLRRYEEARVAMQRAVEIAPHYALARFQLGFLEVTSGDAAAAEATWRPLDAPPGDSPPRPFT